MNYAKIICAAFICNCCLFSVCVFVSVSVALLITTYLIGNTISEYSKANSHNTLHEAVFVAK